MTDEDIRNARILIIDDDSLHARLLVEILDSQGYRYFNLAADSRDAIRLFTEFQPDLIILDWLMPAVGGLQTLAQLRSVISKESYLPILVVTAAPNIEVKRQALASGATDFLTKPYDSSEIVLRVNNLLRTRILHRRLEDNERRFRALFENELDSILIANDDGRYVDANPAASALLGYTRDELLRLTSSEIAMPAKFGAKGEEQRPLLAEAEQSGAFAILRKDGTSADVEYRSVANFLPGLHYLVMRNVSERNRAESARRESVEGLRQVLETLPAATYTCDGEGRITYFNGRASQLWGRSPKLNDAEERFCGSWGLCQPDGIPMPHEESWMAKAVTEGMTVTGKEMIVQRPDGSHSFVLAYASPILDASGIVVSAVNVLVDITERRRIETALQEAKTDADTANRAKSEFLSRMSHELRTPLNAILGFAQVLELNSLEREPQECVTHILRAGKHLLRLINEVLDLSAIESGRLTFSIEAVRVREVVRECVDLIRPLASARSLRIELPHDNALDVYVLADRQRLKQALLNLLANAVKYNRPGGGVTVSWEERPAERLRIFVRDTGSGIAPEHLDRIFVPFDRLGADRGDVEGSGLGLALSKRLIEAMGGEIGAESVVGVGSAFWIGLPRSPSPMANVRDAGALPASFPRIQRGTILYIEDNLSNLTLIEFLFSQRPQIKLLAAMQGRLGIELAREHQPALILLDLHLPDMMGHKVLASLKSDASTSHIPVAMLTADASPSQEARLLAAGADAYLTKPIDVPRLLRLIEKTLGSPIVDSREI